MKLAYLLLGTFASILFIEFECNAAAAPVAAPQHENSSNDSENENSANSSEAESNSSEENSENLSQEETSSNLTTTTEKVGNMNCLTCASVLCSTNSKCVEKNVNCVTGVQCCPTTPVCVQVTEIPDNKPVTTSPDNKPISTSPDNKPVSTSPDNKPVTKVPANKPVTKVPARY